MAWTLLREELLNATQLHNDRVAALRLFQDIQGIGAPDAARLQYEEEVTALCKQVDALYQAGQETQLIVGAGVPDWSGEHPGSVSRRGCEANR